MKLLHKLGRYLGVGMVALTAISTALAEPHILRFSNWQAPTHFITTDMLLPWGQAVENATEGRVKIEFINPLGKPQAHVDLVRNGIADLGMSVHSYTASRFPMVEFAELPFTTEHGGINSVAYWDTYQQFMLDQNEHRGVKLLGAWTSPASVILLTQDNVTSLDDLKGLKLRSPSPLFDAITKELGATPITAPASEAYEMLSRGIIDGMYFQHDQIDNFKLDRLVKSVVVAPSGFGKTSQFLFMNPNKWDSLSSEDQAAILSVSERHMAKAFGEKWHQSEQDAIQKHAAQGLVTYRVEGEAPDQLRQRLAFIETNWIETANQKGINGQAVLDHYRAQLAALNTQP